MIRKFLKKILFQLYEHRDRKAFSYLNSKNLIPGKCHLIVAGKIGRLYKEIIKFYSASPYKTLIKFIGTIDEKDKSTVYSLARVFIYPSFFEGFGFPPLEAMASGIPVITLNSSSLPEVVGGAGLLINPGGFSLAETISGRSAKGSPIFMAKNC